MAFPVWPPDFRPLALLFARLAIVASVFARVGAFFAVPRFTFDVLAGGDVFARVPLTPGRAAFFAFAGRAPAVVFLAAGVDFLAFAAPSPLAVFLAFAGPVVAFF